MRISQRDLENKLEDGLNAVGRGPISTLSHASHAPKADAGHPKEPSEVLDIANWRESPCCNFLVCKVTRKMKIPNLSRGQPRLGAHYFAAQLDDG